MVWLLHIPHTLCFDVCNEASSALLFSSCFLFCLFAFNKSPKALALLVACSGSQWPWPLIFWERSESWLHNISISTKAKPMHSVLSIQPKYKEDVFRVHNQWNVLVFERENHPVIKNLIWLTFYFIDLGVCLTAVQVLLSLCKCFLWAVYKMDVCVKARRWHLASKIPAVNLVKTGVCAWPHVCVCELQ